jgi:hypothetical protein
MTTVAEAVARLSSVQTFAELRSLTLECTTVARTKGAEQV